MATDNKFSSLLREHKVAYICDWQIEDIDVNLIDTLKDLSQYAGLKGDDDTIVFLTNEEDSEEHYKKRYPKQYQNILELSKAVHQLGAEYLWIENSTS